jgi:hypothetical protein
MVRSQQRDDSGAIAESEVATELSGRHSMALSGLGHVLGRAGKREQAAQLLEELRTRARIEYIAPDHFALIHVALGDENRALERLRESVSERSPYAAWLKVEPRFDSLRADARFDTLLRAVFGKGGRAPRLQEEE